MIAFYSVISLGPVLIIVVAIAGFARRQRSAERAKRLN
jgi:uncharacterized BrkB/YihY/UPF0761 family membrane protein